MKDTRAAMTISKNLLIWIFSLIEFTVAATPLTIYKDVVILGGGASGAHAAVRLREDYNKSIIIIEKQDNLVLFFLLVFIFPGLDFCFFPFPSCFRTFLNMKLAISIIK